VRWAGAPTLGHHAGIAAPTDPRDAAPPATDPVHADPIGADRLVVVVVLSDTHLRDDLSKLPAEVWDHVEQADVVLHAGDVVTGDLLDELRARVPVHAVLGNNDHDLVGVLPDRLELDLGGVRTAMVHDSGVRKGREARLRRWFPQAELVVFGHSHEPLDAEGLDGQRLFNPGSAVQRRRQPSRTIGRLRMSGGRIVGHEIVPVGG
jgi:putative phosphoesterase